MKRMSLSFCFVLSGVLLAAGCGEPTLTTGTVAGKVVDGNQPVPHVEVSFVSTAGPRATAITSEDGRFELMLTNGEKGAMVGENAVSVLTGLEVVRPNKAGDMVMFRPPGPSLRYTFQTPLVVAPGVNEFTLDVSTATKGPR